MARVPTLHIRNVPEDVYNALRGLAEREGRSLNSLVARLLSDAVARERRGGELMRRLDELRAEFLLPDEAPKPEDLIREGREERARHLDDITRGL
jgi:plasmid stability protein